MPKDGTDSVGKAKEDYLERIKYISAALEASRRSKTPVGMRLERMMALYNHFFGKDHFKEIPITHEAEVLALVIDHVKVDRKTLKKRAPLLASYYDIFRRSSYKFDTKSLYEFLKPELTEHLKRYSIETE